MKQVYFKRCPNILTADMNGETVMMRMENGKYYNIGEIGGRVWALLENSKSMAELVADLMKEYDVDAERCESDLIPFLDSLKNNGLIEEEEK